MDNKTIKRYFKENTSKWLKDAYVKSDYTYPIGWHRSRIIMNILTLHFGSQNLKLLDIGCGGGDLCIIEAEAGHQATGIDQSEEMIKHAMNRRHTLPNEIKTRLRILHADLRTVGDKLPHGTYDAVTAMGVLYYLPKDDDLFVCARDLLKPGGFFIVSCRNRLFNMFNGSKYMIKEIESGSASDLIANIDNLYHPIPQDKANFFIENIKQVTRQINSDFQQLDDECTLSITQDEVNTSQDYTFDIIGELRQHTPDQLTANAAKFGFVNLGFYGVHPHFLVPKLNKELPPQLFNLLSDCLCTLEDLPVSLIWSSQFIGVFKKENIYIKT